MPEGRDIRITLRQEGELISLGVNVSETELATYLAIMPTEDFYWWVRIPHWHPKQRFSIVEVHRLKSIRD